MIRLASLISLVLLPLLAQDQPAGPAPSAEAVIIPVKTLTGDAFNRLAKMLDVFGVPYKADDQLRTIVAYGPKDKVAQMRAVIEQLDRPGSEAAIGRNVDMTLTFLLCSMKPTTDTRAVPADIEPVVRQLRAATPYKDFAVLDTVPLRVQEGKATRHNSQLPGFSTNVPGQPVTSRMLIRPEAIIQKASDRLVRFAQVEISLRIPYVTNAFLPSGSASNMPFQYREAGIDTAGDFKEGQKTVLGKVSGSDDDSAVFIVISLKILD